MAVDYSLDTFLWIIEGIFGTVHILMLIFLIQKRLKKTKVYMSPFYTIFIWINICDIIYIITNDIGDKLAKYPSLRSFYTADSYFPTGYYALATYVSTLEICGHTILSINRYCVIKNVQINKSGWSRRVKWFFYILLFLAPMPNGAFRLFMPASYTYTEEGNHFLYYLNPVVTKISTYVNLGYYTVNFFVSLVPTVLSIKNLRQLKKSNYQVTVAEKHELKLIIHAICMFVLLSGRFCCLIISIIASYTKSVNAVMISRFLFAIIVSFYALISSLMLLIISTKVRFDFLQFYGLQFVTCNQKSVATVEVIRQTTVAVRPEFDGYDFNDPNCVVVGDAEHNFTYSNLNNAFWLLHERLDSLLLSLGTGKFYQRNDGLCFDVGTYTMALIYATGCNHIEMEKPTEEYFLGAVKFLGLKSEEVTMVGDDIVSDVRGAHKLGIRGVQV